MEEPLPCTRTPRPTSLLWTKAHPRRRCGDAKKVSAGRVIWEYARLCHGAPQQMWHHQDRRSSMHYIVSYTLTGKRTKKKTAALMAFPIIRLSRCLVSG